MKLAKLLPALVCASLSAGVLFGHNAHAHRVWLKPNTTVVSGDEAWITFDAAIANSIFNPDHHAYPLQRLLAVGPDGKAVAMQNSAELRYRSVFDLHLTEPGTYRVFNASRSIVARWVDEHGKRQSWPGRGKTGTAEQFARQVPKNAKDLQVSEVARRLETFVTLGAPNANAIAPSGQGLELNALTHPNDLYVGEAAAMQFLIDGEAASGTSVTLVRQDERYRDQQVATELSADKNGKVTLEFSEPGMYWLEAEYQDHQGKAPATIRQGSYVAVFEVLPL
ncbi:DUF4198 domain-containing protein [Pseudoalteromonas sp. T1lg75]|uniref:DUF4198 domain-containing protein n=1 Tax=Pseudoalteromonas sp. T1lg75 TaxID=2077102 RepID=UPI000CF708C5|nr:DUF4198 domain-containing protein [Pseudoalteromonas sp. T1lg75]